jgi:hypothetical protein
MKKKPAAKGSKKKPSSKRQRHQIIVLKDGADNYYEIRRATFERYKVSPGRKAKVIAAVKDFPAYFGYIPGTSVPGSMAAPKFADVGELKHVGSYLSSSKA